MRILKLFDKFMTNHSSQAYQVVIIAVRKEYQFEELLKGQIDRYSIPDIEKIDEQEAEELEEERKIEITSLLDTHNVYRGFSSSEDEHGFYEGGVDAGDYGNEEDALMNYWHKWMDDQAKIINKIELIGKDKIKILYFDQDID